MCGPDVTMFGFPTRRLKLSLTDLGSSGQPYANWIRIKFTNLELNSERHENYVLWIVIPDIGKT